MMYCIFKFKPFCLLLVVFMMSAIIKVSAQQNNRSSFKVLPLGVKGGLDESNLSAYLVAAAGSENYVCLDAGSLHTGIKKAIQQKLFKGSVSQVLQQNIKGYLLSHAHLDHLSGLIINSPGDTKKNIYAFPEVLQTLKTHYFTWKSWANFGNEGDLPILNKYQYIPLKENQEIVLAQTDLRLKTFKLSHVNPDLSTAFLISDAKNQQILYLGDTGADEIEKSNRLQNLWQQIAPAVKSKQLKAILIEVSFPDEIADSQLFGHLKPELLMKEMQNLAQFAGVDALKNFPIVITHIKPSGNNEKIIKQQLKTQNKLGLQFVFPKQGKLLAF